MWNLEIDGSESCRRIDKSTTSTKISLKNDAVAIHGSDEDEAEEKKEEMQIVKQIQGKLDELIHWFLTIIWKIFWDLLKKLNKFVI